MAVPLDTERSGAIDLDRARADWLRALPSAGRTRLLSSQEAHRILEPAAGFLLGGAAEDLAEAEAQAYRVASRLVAEVGPEAALRYLRDSLLGALSVSVAGAAGERLARLSARLSDAVWCAHADALQRTISRERDDHLRRELALAKRIQERLLPKSIPQIPGFDIAGRVLPAAEVGGDYWSCKNYPEDDIVTFKLADVTGHGIAAATLVAAVKFISGGYYRGSKTAAQVMERTNTVLVRETPHEILVTMVYGWLYPLSGEMSVVNAGHAPVLHYHRLPSGEGRFRSIPPTGLALGLTETKYAEVRIPMEPGDVFFTCSDGITEPSGTDALGEEWVEEQIAAAPDVTAAELVSRVLEGALRHYGTPRDDMSVLAVRRVS
jgi:hypothetical protein